MMGEITCVGLGSSGCLSCGTLEKIERLGLK